MKAKSTNGLNARQVRFCEEFIAAGLNGTEAAKRSGYGEKAAHVQASRLLTVIPSFRDPPAEPHIRLNVCKGSRADSTVTVSIRPLLGLKRT